MKNKSAQSLSSVLKDIEKGRILRSEMADFAPQWEAAFKKRAGEKKEPSLKEQFVEHFNKKIKRYQILPGGKIAQGAACLLIARSFYGKTSMLVDAAMRLAIQDKKKVVFVSLEVPKEDMFARFLGWHMKENYEQFIGKTGFENEINEMFRGMEDRFIITDRQNRPGIDWKGAIEEALSHKPDVLIVEAAAQLIKMTETQGNEILKAEYIAQEIVSMAKNRNATLILSAHSNAGRSFSDVRWYGPSARQYFDMEFILHVGRYIQDNVQKRAFALEVTKDRYDGRNVDSHYLVNMGKNWRIDIKASRSPISWDNLKLFAKMRNIEEGLRRHNPDEKILKLDREGLLQELDDLGTEANIDDFIKDLGEDKGKKDGKEKKGKKQKRG